jgi:hypothetical protein
MISAVYRKYILPVFLFILLVPGSVNATTAYCFGDSFTAYNVYPPIIGTAQGWTVTNKAVSATIAAEWSYNLYNTTVATTNKGWVLGGFNNERKDGTNTTALAEYKNFLYAMGVWMALPDASKIRGQSGTITYTGSWSNVSIAYHDGTTTTMAKSSYTQNDTAQISLTGTTIYVGYMKTPAVSGGTFTVHVDGVLKGTYNAYGNVASWSDYLTQGIRIANLANTSHTVLITVTSATDANNKVYLEWFASNGSIDESIQFYIASTCKMTSTGYTLGSPNWNHGSDTAVNSYSQQAQEVVCSLYCDGLKVYLADAESYFLIPGDVGGDGVHPNSGGYQHIADGFNYAINNNSIGSCSACASSITGPFPTFLP